MKISVGPEQYHIIVMGIARLARLARHTDRNRTVPISEIDNLPVTGFVPSITQLLRRCRYRIREVFRRRMAGRSPDGSIFKG